MKHITFIFINFVLGIFFFTSCISDIISKKPLDMISDDIVWSDKNVFESYMASMYRDACFLVQDISNDAKNTTKHNFGAAEIINISDEANPSWGHVGISSLKTNGININTKQFQWWDKHYALVRQLNTIIERLPDTDFEDEFKNLRISEARFLRAFSYFAMVKRYGGVPLVTKVMDLNASYEEAYPKRNTEQEIYDFIISEMDEIEEGLDKTTDYGRPTKFAALALKCRAALYAASIAQFGQIQLDGVLGIPNDLSSSYYTTALNAAKEIIGSGKFALFNKYPDKTQNFKNLFLEKEHCEDIFVVQHNEVPYKLGGNSWGWDYHQRPKPHQINCGMGSLVYLETVEAFDYIDGTSGKFDREELDNPDHLWTAEELFKDRDPRFEASIYHQETKWTANGERHDVDFHKGIIDENGVLNDSNNGNVHGIPNFGTQYTAGMNFGTGFGIMKYLDETRPVDRNDSNSKTDYMVFRFAEILLNAAEAAFELGNTSEALDYVNQIRERAGVAKLTTISRDLIRKERQVELMFEGHRYWDLRRWRIAEDVLSQFHTGIRYILDYNSYQSGTPKYRIMLLSNFEGRKPCFKESNYYLPVQQNRTNANVNLVENPGYENIN